MGKGFEDFFKTVDADVFCLQETKLSSGQLDFNPEGYQSFWNYAQKKGYSGTALFSKETPKSVVYGMGIEEHDNEGRVIAAEFEYYYVVTVYTPNSQRELTRLSYRMLWEDAFRGYLNGLRKKKPVIVCGDMNVAHQEIDLKNPKTNVGKCLLILSAIFIRIQVTDIRGGPICSMPASAIWDGALTISSLLRNLRRNWFLLISTGRLWVRTTARSSLWLRGSAVRHPE